MLFADPPSLLRTNLETLLIRRLGRCFTRMPSHFCQCTLAQRFPPLLLTIIVMAIIDSLCFSNAHPRRHRPRPGTGHALFIYFTVTMSARKLNVPLSRQLIGAMPERGRICLCSPRLLLPCSFVARLRASDTCPHQHLRSSCGRPQSMKLQ